MTADDPGRCTERELHEPVDLCRPDGRLAPEAIGWSRQPVHHCELPGSWGRRKRWDYWCITAPGHVLSVTYANVDYVGLADVWFLDLESTRTLTRAAIAPLAHRFAMPSTVAGADMRVEQRGFRLAIIEEDGGTRLQADWRDRDGSTCDLDVLVHRPARHESLSVVIPWSSRRFQCTTKDNTRPATGELRSGNSTYAFGEDAWGCLDFGRGKWPYSTRWNWGAASGRIDGHVLGLQLGGKWTVGTGMTENALCVDGRLSKLSEELVWTYDPADWLRPWKIRTPRSDRIDLTFTPVHDKATRLQAGIASSAVHQCFGHYSGTVLPDRGQPIRVERLFGWAEEARWRW